MLSWLLEGQDDTVRNNGRENDPVKPRIVDDLNHSVSKRVLDSQPAQSNSCVRPGLLRELLVILLYLGGVRFLQSFVVVDQLLTKLYPKCVYLLSEFLSAILAAFCCRASGVSAGC